MSATTWTCGWCRGEFTPNRAWQKFCSPPCKRSARARRVLNTTKNQNQPVTAQWTGGPGGPARRTHPPARIVTFSDYLAETGDMAPPKSR